jgi:hypothetical protein
LVHQPQTPQEQEEGRKQHLGVGSPSPTYGGQRWFWRAVWGIIRFLFKHKKITLCVVFVVVVSLYFESKEVQRPSNTTPVPTQPTP